MRTLPLPHATIRYLSKANTDGVLTTLSDHRLLTADPISPIIAVVIIVPPTTIARMDGLVSTSSIDSKSLLIITVHNPSANRSAPIS
jgi:hypothetical protein